ncbi:MAG TPA: TetR/AcrR family transcriptional regulator [Streptosporangiaceae bacterium]|jgi:AcrR family transcriptional regulator|nr:TetR/AcrR family transcriptional regulator [Streptosporangiaceae bacterium]
MESIWLRPERSARGPVPEHSRAEIARAAVTLADQGGLAAVTMRSVAAAIGTGPASLYRYVSTRAEILELMADETAGEYQFGPEGPKTALHGLLQLARQARRIFQRHPWLIDLPSVGGLPGPNAIAFTEQVLAILDHTELTSRARLETVGIFTGLVRLLARTEADQQQTGQQLADWQGALAGYLVAAVSDGQHPYLAAALAGQASGPAAPGPASGPDGTDDDLFDRALTRILPGLLAPSASQPHQQ